MTPRQPVKEISKTTPVTLTGRGTPKSVRNKENSST